MSAKTNTIRFGTAEGEAETAWGEGSVAIMRARRAISFAAHPVAARVPAPLYRRPPQAGSAGGFRRLQTAKRPDLQERPGRFFLHRNVYESVSGAFFTGVTTVVAASGDWTMTCSGFWMTTAGGSATVVGVVLAAAARSRAAS